MTAASATTAQPARDVVAEYRSYSNPVLVCIHVNADVWRLQNARMRYRLILERERVAWFGGEFEWQKTERMRGGL